MASWAEAVECACILRYTQSSFANHICASFLSYPDLVHLLRIDIPPRTGAYGFFLGLWVVRICIRDGSIQNKMCGNAAVFVRRIVGVSEAMMSPIACAPKSMTLTGCPSR